jgi:hypothetical protein
VNNRRTTKSVSYVILYVFSVKVNSKHNIRLLLQQLTSGNVEEISTGVLVGKFADVSASVSCDSSTEQSV